MKMPSHLALHLAAILMALTALAVHAAEKGPAVEWTAAGVNGLAVKVPATRPSVLLFALAEQPASVQAIAQLKGVAGLQDAQAVVIVSGKDATAGAKKLTDEAKLPWPVVADEEYAASGKMSVHAWPTTVIIRADGEQVGHLPGLPKSYGKDVESYLAYAAGRIDAVTLAKRLGSDDFVIDSRQQMAQRHLPVAQRLMDKGQAEQAKVELAAGLKLQADNPALQLAMVDVLLILKETAEAAKLLDGVDAKAASPVRLKLLRGRLLVAQEKWDEAREVLTSAVQLNPDPSDAYYELGLVHQHLGNFKAAASAYRLAFETTPSGRKLATTKASGRP